MKTAGILCEFNPFHNGHEALICHARQTHEAVVCVMSGNLVQRGDIAVFDRFTRTEMALLCGADLVVELPVGWSMAGAEQFALGGMSLLCDCGVDSVLTGCRVDHEECFGRVDGLFDGNDFVHHLLIDSQAAGSVDNYQVVMVLASVGDGVFGNLYRVFRVGLGVDGYFDLFTQHFQLLGSCGTVDVAGNE